jgi:hypothetical protein
MPPGHPQNTPMLGYEAHDDQGGPDMPWLAPGQLGCLVWALEVVAIIALAFAFGMSIPKSAL